MPRCGPGHRGTWASNVPGPVLIDAIRRVASGETVLGLIAEGLSNREIGQRMRLAPSTVKNYVPQLLAELGLKNRTQAAILATQLRNSRHDEPAA
jgi:DNA-binding CsgD family transcriptional regulator